MADIPILGKFKSATTDGILADATEVYIDDEISVADAIEDLSGQFENFYVTAGKKAGTTVGEKSTAEGEDTEASGDCAHAEGFGTVASGELSHAEGSENTASGFSSHAEGGNTVASGSWTHTEGWSTRATHRSQHVFGEFNIPDPSSSIGRGTYVEIVGNGSLGGRSNARTLDWNGNETLAGKLTLGAGPTNNMDAATKQYVDSNRCGGTIGFEYSQLANYTFQDVKDAVDAGKTPYILYYGSIRAYLCEWVRTSGDAYICSFTGIDPSGISGSIYRFNGNRAQGNAMTDSLGLLVFSSVPIASASGVELTESNGALVNSDIRMDEVSAKENFFVNSGGSSYQKEYTWYTTIYYKNFFVGYAGEMIIKNETTGAFYKHTGLDATLNFQPYTP